MIRPGACMKSWRAGADAAGGGEAGAGADDPDRVSRAEPGGSVGRCERAQEGTGGAMGSGDALTRTTPHTLPTEATGRTTGHAGRQTVRKGRRRARHTARATQRAHRAATGHDRGTWWAQIPIDIETLATAPTEAHTAPQTVGGCHNPPTARNAPHRARRSPTQGTAWHGGTASAPRPDPAPQMPHSTHTTAEPQSRKLLKTQGFYSPTKKSCSNLKKVVDMWAHRWYICLRW